MEFLKKESARRGKTLLGLAEEIRAQIPVYLKSAKFKSEFAWGPKTWFLEGHYRDDPSTWGASSGGGKGEWSDEAITERCRQRAIERENAQRERQRRQAAGE